ncbi:hypothetical protein OTK49_02945 [Vibrio coralliirubri]|uniref:hypothetical protein n=1 Tax=Vibrio coralliirubri TaxID=1516159 RepID=UPI0022845395|nr:hypothetical protein [Vibrio coralliirubri]MCY9861472.1 hypothetical protein [Vibrio coralliirubri]
MINLTSFKKNNPDSVKYLTALENTLTKLVYNREDRTSSPELPFPQRLISEHYQVPPFMCNDILVNQSKLSYMINTHLTFLRNSLTMDSAYYATIIDHKYPETAEFFGCPDEFSNINNLECKAIIDAHMYHQSPTVEISDGLAELLSNTNLNNLKSIPVGFIRSKYTQFFLDLRSYESLPQIGDMPINGIYYRERRFTPTEQGEGYVHYLNSEPSIKRAIDSGALPLDKPLIGVEIVMIAQDDINAPLSDGYSTTLFSYIYNEEDGNDLSIWDVVNQHNPQTDIIDSETQFSFEYMREPLSAIFNVLLYMNATEEEREIVKAGTELEVKIKEVTNKKKKRRLEKLRDKEYDRIRIGKQYRLKGLLRTTSDSSGKKETHIRGGHWRKQRYGKNRAIVKPKWIMPMVIGSGNPSAKKVIIQ